MLLLRRTFLLAALLAALVAVPVASPATPGAPPAPDRAWRRWQTGALRADRLQHASLAFSSGLALGVLAREPAAAAGGALTLALAKELFDARRNRFDAADLVADAAGAALAALATSALGR